MSSRFDYVRYDGQAAQVQENFKEVFTALELAIENNIANSRAKSLALTRLEETYMWIGKGIRDDQIQRNGSAPLQEHRTNS